MASRKEEKERRRQERLAREHAEQQQAQRRRLYATVVGAVLAVAAVAAVVVVIAAGGDSGGSGSGGSTSFDIAAARPPQQRIDALDEAAKAAGCKLSNPPIEGRTHVQEKVKYGTNPPTSGNHNPIPAEDGAYAKSPTDEHLVHSLEHGRVIVWYKPSLPRQRLAQLKGLYDEDTYHMTITSRSAMPYDLAVTAWGHLAGCKKISDESFDLVRTFRDRYRDKGPEFVP